MVVDDKQVREGVKGKFGMLVIFTNACFEGYFSKIYFI